MQCTYDGKGNSVPTILLLMQERLYAQGGLKVRHHELLIFIPVRPESHPRFFIFRLKGSSA
jgi:hypothetical protein